MIYKIAELLRDEISGLNIVEVAAGLAAPKIVRNNATDIEADVPEMADITIPMAYNDLGLVCEEGDLYALMPNTKKKSIHWFEDNGVELVSEDTYYYHSRAVLTLVSWWNMPLINATLKSPDILVANLIAAIPTKLTTVDYMSQIRVAFEGQEPNLDEILGRYTFNFPEDQINTYPYALTGLRFSVDFAFGKNCVDPILISPSTCPPKMVEENFSLMTFTYSGAQLTFFMTVVTSPVTLDWGDGTTEEIPVSVGARVSSYTANGTYTIKVRGAPRVTLINIGNASTGGTMLWLSKFKQLQSIYIDNGAWSGDISTLHTLTSLTNLQIVNFASTFTITGSVIGFSAMTLLENLELYSLTNVAGSIEGFSSLTALFNLDLTETPVTGDIALVLPSLTNIIIGIYLSDTAVDYTTASLPTWDGIDLWMDGIGLSDSEIDSILSDLVTASVVNCDIDIDGTNGAPTDDVDYETLIAAGNTVAVNARGLNGGGGTDTDWLFLQGVDNLPLLWTGSVNMTYTRVTGNGFTGYAIRSSSDAVQTQGGLIILVDADGNDIFTVGNSYTVACTYRKKIGSVDIVINDPAAGRPVLTAVDNEGAAAVATTAVFTAGLTLLRIYFYDAVPNSVAIGDWFEIDEIVVTEI